MMNIKKAFYFVLLIQIIVSGACNTTKESDVSWENLFDGKTLEGWHGYNKGNTPVDNWIVEDGALVCLGSAPGQPNGSLVTDREYENFILEWEWKIDKGSNSGVFYHVVEDAIQYERGPQQTGPEYQIIDDENFPTELEDWQKTGADYAMYIPNKEKKMNPQGEWNTSKIVYDNGKVEHYLNGEKIVEFVAGSEDWITKRESGKWKDFPGYAKVKKGAIALQDHNSKAYFKNIKIKTLK
ncbi:DUF1080 domain-containing protein [Dysgonomonas sp. Marseille-P4677]|uniref:3-keto-disaccharide hydrolase n=1 Tax=Dysgonomonas sp. Marseille-P4677 TaxID=2364790 RepID=UPI001913D1D6|nr:DUF1080 domain-containing protein [Dysgonomonas sp. Marseille-P4677]MBK5719864.1 DUF1080 domain-containing protein [Dysgonomonas sp. Marseille-P4677]